MGETARERLRGIDWQLMGLRTQLDGFGDHPRAEGEHRDALMKQMTALGVERRKVQREVLREQEVRMSRQKARELRKTFREQYAATAARYRESQRDVYPQEFREREGASILKELSLIEASHSRDMLLWHHAQRVEAARLRAADPVGDPAQETRRLREQMEVSALAERYPSHVEARNHLLPEAWRRLNAGNVGGAQVYAEAARKRGVEDGNLDHEINRVLDNIVPHRKQAVEIEVTAADELELSRRDIAAAHRDHKIGTPVELVRADNAVQMADYKRRLEAPRIKQELGVELPASTD
jgi:hypothetical protein